MKNTSRRENSKRELVSVRDCRGGSVHLVFKYPDLEAAYHRVLWRRGEQAGIGCRDLMGRGGDFWIFGLRAARSLFLKADCAGFWASKWDRWSEAELLIFDSATTERNDKLGLAAALLTERQREHWTRVGNFRIVACREPAPSPWWRVLIFSESAEIVAVQSVAENWNEKIDAHCCTEKGWSVYPILMDADTATHRVHMRALLENVRST